MTRSRRLATVAILGVAGVVAYIASWAMSGMLWPGYDPATQAISELFAFGAPIGTRVALSVGLVASGLGLVGFGWALDVGLPGRGRLGPGLAVLSGVMTVAVTAFPCTAGCPGAGASLTDTMHAITAGTGYVTLFLAPLAVAWRVRRLLPRLAVAGAILGGGGLLLFVARTTGITWGGVGLQQRIFNTAADLWYVLAAVVIVRRAGGGRPPR